MCGAATYRHVCVCVCVCVSVCVYACMYGCVYVWVCACVCMYVCRYVCMYVFMYIRTYADMHVCMYVIHTYVCLYVCMFVCLYVCMYTYYVLINPPMPIHYVLAAVFASCFYVLKSLLQEWGHIYLLRPRRCVRFVFLRLFKIRFVREATLKIPPSTAWWQDLSSYTRTQPTN